MPDASPTQPDPGLAALRQALQALHQAIQVLREETAQIRQAVAALAGAQRGRAASRARRPASALTAAQREVLAAQPRVRVLTPGTAGDPAHVTRLLYRVDRNYRGLGQFVGRPLRPATPTTLIVGTIVFEATPTWARLLRIQPDGSWVAPTDHVARDRAADLVPAAEAALAEQPWHDPSLAPADLGAAASPAAPRPVEPLRPATGERVLACLRDQARPMTTTEIRSVIGGRTSTVRTALIALASDGQVVSTGIAVRAGYGRTRQVLAWGLPAAPARPPSRAPVALAAPPPAAPPARPELPGLLRPEPSAPVAPPVWHAPRQPQAPTAAAPPPAPPCPPLPPRFTTGGPERADPVPLTWSPAATPPPPAFVAPRPWPEAEPPWRPPTPLEQDEADQADQVERGRS